MGSRSRNWMFTSFSVEAKLAVYLKYVSYAMWQLEKAPDTGRLHRQGYIECDTTVSLNQLKKWLPDAHFETRRGAQSDAIKYCSKEDTRVEGPFEWGTKKEQGKRNDIGSCVESIKTGSGIRAVIEEHTAVFFKYPKAVDRVMRIFQPPMPRPKPQIRYLWGPPGTGKSRVAHAAHPNAFIGHDCKEAWFDGYEDQDCIIFDDFAAEFPLRFMLRLLDYNPLSLPVKGGFVTVKAYKFIFTSNYPPHTLYQGDSAWMRRIEEFSDVVEFNERTLLGCVLLLFSVGPSITRHFCAGLFCAGAPPSVDSYFGFRT